MPDFKGLNTVAKAAFSPRAPKQQAGKDPVIVNRPGLAAKLDRAGNAVHACRCCPGQGPQDPAGPAQNGKYTVPSTVQGGRKRGFLRHSHCSSGAETGQGEHQAPHDRVLCSACTCSPSSEAGKGPVFEGNEGKTGPFDQGGHPPGADVVGNYDYEGRHPTDRPDRIFPKNQNPGSVLAGQILAEEEVRLPAAGPRDSGKPVDPGKVDQARDRIRAAGGKGRLVLAYSGGADSTVLLDLAATTELTGPRPLVVWCDTGMEYPGSRGFVEGQAGRYGLELRTAKAPRAPQDQFQNHGWPMLGKMAARIWNQGHQGAGFTLNVSECCRVMKIGPTRRLTRNLGAVVQLTGQRGRTDDRLRGLREHLDGILTWQARDRMWISSPLTGWTDDDVRGYARAAKLPEHPAKACGAATIGCVYCGGGSQFTNSGYRILRKAWPEAWRRFMVEWGGGEIILALKYGQRLDRIREAIAELGGLGRLAEERPWIFDFTRHTPLKGYAKGAR